MFVPLMILALKKKNKGFRTRGSFLRHRAHDSVLPEHQAAAQRAARADGTGKAVADHCRFQCGRVQGFALVKGVV